jgi:hypothetical protein
MNIGFSGTRNGMTLAQREMFSVSLDSYVRGSTELCSFRHGDCVGADCEAHDTVCTRYPDIKIYVYPADLGGRYRANCSARFPKSNIVKIYAPERPLVRNRIIVDASDIVFACPDTKESRRYSGTWSTIKYARTQGTRCFIIFPDGSKELR